jgi:hypothetical protein
VSAEALAKAGSDLPQANRIEEYLLILAWFDTIFASQKSLTTNGGLADVKEKASVF